MRRVRTPLRYAWLILPVFLLAAGCGFQLRTYDLGTSVESFYVKDASNNPLASPLRRALRQAGVDESSSASDAEVVVVLLNAQRGRRSVSVTGQARAAEYEITLGVQYRVLDGQGQELIAPRWVRGTRVFRVDRDNIVGTSEEQALLEREIQNDLIQQIVRALNTVSGPTSPTGQTADAA